MALYAMTLLAVGPPDQVREAASRHREHLRRLRAAGKLRCAGEFPDEDGFLEIYDVADRLEADAVARSSPLVEDGLASWMLREWRPLTGR